MFNLKKDNALPTVWDERLEKMNCLKGSEALKELILKSTHADNLEETSVAEFKLVVENALRFFKENS